MADGLLRKIPAGWTEQKSVKDAVFVHVVYGYHNDRPVMGRSLRLCCVSCILCGGRGKCPFLRACGHCWRRRDDERKSRVAGFPERLCANLRSGFRAATVQAIGLACCRDGRCGICAGLSVRPNQGRAGELRANDDRSVKRRKHIFWEQRHRARHLACRATIFCGAGENKKRGEEQ